MAEPQDDDGGDTGCPDANALGALRFTWADAYVIGWNASGGWSALRRDGAGQELAAPSPDALGRAMAGDFAFRPVRREAAL